MYGPRLGRISFEFGPSATFCPGENSGIGGNLELLDFCLLTRSDEFLRANSNAMCRFSRVEWTNFSVVVNLPILEISKIISIGNLACRPNIEKNDIS